MATLVSPGVSVTITDESFFIPAAAATVPLFFIATAEDKLQPDDVTPAAGTSEHSVLRTVTTLQESLALFGGPRFLEDFQGNAQHGDARNEYGLLAVNQFLGTGSRAFVVRANVNLNDDIDDIRTSWDSVMQEAAFALESLVTAFMDEYNIANGYTPLNVNYKTTVTAAELISLAHQATADVWDKYSFRNLEDDFFDDNTTPGTASSGFQVVDVGGAVTPITSTGLPNDASVWQAIITVDGTDYPISVTGSAAQTYAALLGVITPQLGGFATIDYDPTPITGPGNLKVTSASTGLTSTVVIDDSTFTPNALFTDGLSAFIGFGTPITGTPADALMPVYGNGYDQPATDDFYGFEGMVNDCIAQGYCPTVANEFTAVESSDVLADAADLFKFTVEFLNLTSLGANDAARRVEIVTALAAEINSNTEVRSEAIEYNLILCPGYHEVVDEMAALSVAINEEAMVIADAPMTMDVSEVVTWADTNSGRVRGTNVAYYYPHALTSNVDGRVVVGAASGVAARTIAYSDNVAEIWFAPAGTQRGLVSGVTATGYVTGTLGYATTFVETKLSTGQRDNLYKYFTNINPITFIPGRGILVFGQKTSASAASARDRVNVERMLMYVKRQLRKNALPFAFEPNDALTRAGLKSTVDSFLGELLVKRGLYDFATVCDESNNTPDRIDRNEMYIDVALKPTRAAEFIYIPIRVVATDAEI